MNENFCLAPWACLYIGALYIKPCCLWRQTAPSWDSVDDIEKVWNSEWMQEVRDDFLNGRIPKECNRCLNRIQPRNIWIEDRLGQYIDKETLTLNPPLKPLQIDFHLGNKCNLQCRMCASWATRNWYELDKMFMKMDPKFARYPIKKYELDVSMFKDCKEMFTDIVRFDFKGGEPMLHDSMVEMIEYIVSWGNSHNIALSYVSNCSVINEKAMNLWKHFKEVRIVASIDGTDELFSYIRGFDFKKFKETIEIYDKIENMIGLHNVAISIYNILDIKNLDEWMMNRDLKRFPCKEKGYSFDCNVIDPTYLDVRILPKKYKQLALKQFENNKRNTLIPFIKWLESIQDIPANEEQLRLFVSFTNMMDEIKGTDFLTLKPEFEELFKEYS
ncbi:MAG: twitch domain-containing radical SAM protein [Candidatus Heimdallarchaeaceae archaeon]